LLALILGVVDMIKEYKYKQASPEELKLFTLVGEALCAIQHLEDALSHSMVLKKTKPRIRAEADKLLEEHRSFTLGEAIKNSKKDN
jgi:hypothetical protein